MMRRIGLSVVIASCAAVLFGAAVPGASAKQVVTGHAEIAGKKARLNVGDRIGIFKHKNFAEVDFVCGTNGNANNYTLHVKNLENQTIWVTYELVAGNNRRARPIDPGEDSAFVGLREPDIGITDTRHKYLTLNVDWGRQEDEDGGNPGKGCILSSHGILHFPDGTPYHHGAEG